MIVSAEQIISEVMYERGCYDRDAVVEACRRLREAGLLKEVHPLYPGGDFPSVGPGDPKDCPGQHGTACCGWPEICRETLGRKPQ